MFVLNDSEWAQKVRRHVLHGARVAVVVTTSTFTKQARDYAPHMGVRLFDEHDLAAWAGQTGPAPGTDPPHRPHRGTGGPPENQANRLGRLTGAKRTEQAESPMS